MALSNFSSSEVLTRDLLAAVREGSVPKLQLVLTDPSTGRVDWDQSSRYGTALNMAAYFGQLELVKLLLDNGADINARNEEGNVSDAIWRAALTPCFVPLPPLGGNNINIFCKKRRHPSAQSRPHGTHSCPQLAPAAYGR